MDSIIQKMTGMNHIMVKILKKIAEIISYEHFTGMPKEFSLKQVEVLIYDDIKYDYKTIGELNKYKSDDGTLKKEYQEFMQYWKELEPDRNEMKEIQKTKKERQEKLERIKNDEEKKAKELVEYLKLKEKYENSNKI